MVMGELAESTEVAVIGGGPGGYVAAIRLAQLGKQVTVVDSLGKEGLGGICLHHGCIPSKALITAADQFYEMLHAEHMGIKAEKVTMDLAQLQVWKSGIISTLTQGIANLFEKHNVELVQGKAFFENSRRIGIESEHGVSALEFQHAIIATGATPIELPGFPFSDPKIMSYHSGLDQTTLPKSLAVVGGGYIGIELGTYYAKLGSKVSILEAQGQILGGQDKDLVRVVERQLRKLGAEIFLNTKALGVENGKVSIEQEGQKKELEAEKVMVTIGVRPNTGELRLENTRVQRDEKGFLKVNERMQTDDPGIYAVGDVAGQPMLAHKAFRQGKVAAECIAGLEAAFDNKVVPAVIFSDPEIATIGHTEDSARNAGYEVAIGKFPFAASGRALTLNASEGFVKLVAEAKTGALLGAQIVGPSASDLIAEVALAIEMGAVAEDLAYTIHPHPTLPETLAEAAEALLGKAVHIYVPKK